MEQKYRSSLSKERKNKNRLRQCISRKKFLASKNQKPEPTDEEKEVKSRKRAAYRLSLSHDRFNSMHIRELASKKKYQDSMKGRAAIKRKNAAYYKSEKKKLNIAAFPPFHSVYVPPNELNETKLIVKFLKQAMSIDANKYLYPIIPFTNDCRMNYRSPQALRIFFGRDVNYLKNDFVKRNIYGPLAVLKSTGPHPDNFHVFPFSPLLRNLQKNICEKVRKRIPNIGIDLDFNSLEIKIYIGPNLFLDKYGLPLRIGKNKPLRSDCNNRVGLHNDVCYLDNGNQKINDTTNGEHPIVTLSIGSTRQLTFVRTKKKNHNKSWWNCNDRNNIIHSLENGSMFILSPDDEKPLYFEQTLHKTKHRAHLQDNGISFALVFRSLKTASYFDKDDIWKWEEDSNFKQGVQRILQRNDKKFAAFANEKKKQDLEKEMVHKMISEYVSNL